MKSFAARLSVVVLAATGFAASTLVSYASTKKHEVRPLVIASSGTCPMCRPSNPGPCQMD